MSVECVAEDKVASLNKNQYSTDKVWQPFPYISIFCWHLHTMQMDLLLPVSV